MSKTTPASESRPSDHDRERGGTDAPPGVGGSRAFALLLVITGAAGLLAAWVITLDKFKLLEDPDFTPGCSLNPVVSCGNIMQSEQ
ncbi:vitamin K epoxide reductase family protein, partial [Streptomyces longisporoflavus]|uniref:vitamin K epoxide reductase family protein n=1 Tax=Streptomyces longisporoflavus TaxID=28044 RepID=UPI0027E43571